MTLKELPLLLGKQHMLKLGLSEYQYYQALKDPTLAVTVGKKTFVSKDKFLMKLNERNNTDENQ